MWGFMIFHKMHIENCKIFIHDYQHDQIITFLHELDNIFYRSTFFYVFAMVFFHKMDHVNEELWNDFML